MSQDADVFLAVTIAASAAAVAVALVSPTNAYAESTAKSVRQEVIAVTGEDSGSVHCQRRAMQVNASATMGGGSKAI